MTFRVQQHDLSAREKAHFQPTIILIFEMPKPCVSPRLDFCPLIAEFGEFESMSLKRLYLRSKSVKLAYNGVFHAPCSSLQTRRSLSSWGKGERQARAWQAGCVSSTVALDTRSEVD